VREFAKSESGKKLEFDRKTAIVQKGSPVLKRPEIKGKNKNTTKVSSKQSRDAEKTILKDRAFWESLPERKP